jgi:methionyl-tRNA formyltransferase
MKVLVISDHDILRDYVLNMTTVHDLDVITSNQIPKGLDNKIQISDVYDVIWSVHCKKILPSHIIENFTCINIHPGFNPHNRGHAPQVFSLINGRKCGVTIHLIDKYIDHGAILLQEEVTADMWDTSDTLYNKIIECEKKLLQDNFDKLTIDNSNQVTPTEGNINYRKDFDKLCKLDMNSSDSLENHINLLRALTHDGYKNAYYTDKNGNKIYVEIKLTLDTQ